MNIETRGSDISDQNIFSEVAFERSQSHILLQGHVNQCKGRGNAR